MKIGDLGVDEHEDVSRSSTTSEEEMELRRGPWTVEEDLVLMNYITCHGEGRWNSLARCAGLKRTGKSCRLRWLNYLRPDVRRGNITPEEQLLILELHSRWGNRWSKIAQHLPGRTDNEIKNYWRTRVQKHAKQMKCDVNSKQFKDVMRYLWMPRLLERIRAAKSSDRSAYPYPDSTTHAGVCQTAAQGSGFGQVNLNPSSESSCGAASSLDSSSVGTHIESPVMVAAGCAEGGEVGPVKGNDAIQTGQSQWDPYLSEMLPSPAGYSHPGLLDSDWWSVGDLSENLWSIEDNWLIQQQQNL